MSGSTETLLFRFEGRGACKSLIPCSHFEVSVQMCEAGGTTKPSANFMTGKTSRSLKAAYRVVTEKLAPKAAHLDGGVYAWCVSNLLL